jgi:hypothetical protein
MLENVPSETITAAGTEEREMAGLRLPIVMVMK